MDFLSQAATAAKTKVALVNAVGFLMASKHTYLHYAPVLPLFSTCSVFKILVDTKKKSGGLPVLEK